jgi:hypothetical protein
MAVRSIHAIYTPYVSSSLGQAPSILIVLLQYQLALYQIDSMRKDGKFVGIDGSIPEGQGIVMAHLNECHELLEMVRSPTLLSVDPPDVLRTPPPSPSY